MTAKCQRCGDRAEDWALGRMVRNGPMVPLCRPCRESLAELREFKREAKRGRKGKP